MDDRNIFYQSKTKKEFNSLIAMLAVIHSKNLWLFIGTNHAHNFLYSVYFPHSLLKELLLFRIGIDIITSHHNIAKMKARNAKAGVVVVNNKKQKKGGSKILKREPESKETEKEIASKEPPAEEEDEDQLEAETEALAEQQAKEAATKPPVTSFADLGVIPELADSCKLLGWKKPTEIQIQAIPQALAGKSLHRFESPPPYA